MLPCHELACRWKVAASCRQAWTTCPLVCECADTYVSSLTTVFQFYLWFRMIWSGDNGLWVASEQYTELGSPHTLTHTHTHTHTHTRTHTRTVWIVNEGLRIRSPAGTFRTFPTETHKQRKNFRQKFGVCSETCKTFFRNTNISEGWPLYYSLKYR